MKKLNKMKYQRPGIPNEVKREVRQRCGFGCVVCGCPIYEYEHMKEYAIVKRHISEEITLLCPMHHSLKTRKLLSPLVIEENNKDPYNRRNSYTKPEFLNYFGNSAIILIGGSTFEIIDEGHGIFNIPLKVLGQPIIKVSLNNNEFFLDILLCDENDNVLLKVENNNVIYNIDVWDIEYTANRLIIRQASGKIFIDIVFEVPNKIYFKRGEFFYKGNNFKLKENQLLINNKIFRNPILFSGNYFHNCTGGIDIQ